MYVILPLSLVKVEREKKYEVGEVLNSRIHHRHMENLILWIRYELPNWMNVREEKYLKEVDTLHELYLE